MWASTAPAWSASTSAIRSVLLSSKNWVARNGLPKGPADLAKGSDRLHDTARFSGYLREVGIPLEAAVSGWSRFPRLRSENGLTWGGRSGDAARSSRADAGRDQSPAGHDADCGADLARHPPGIAVQSPHPPGSQDSGRGTAPACRIRRASQCAHLTFGPEFAQLEFLDLCPIRSAGTPRPRTSAAASCEARASSRM